MFQARGGVVTQPEDKSILREIVRIVESRRRVPDRVQIQAREYLITYLEDHRNRLDEALRRYDPDRLNMLFGQLASKIKYQFNRMVPARAVETRKPTPPPKTPAAAKPAAAKPAATKSAAPRAAAAKPAATKGPRASAKKTPARKPVAKKAAAPRASKRTPAAKKTAKKSPARKAKPAAKKHK